MFLTRRLRIRVLEIEEILYDVLAVGVLGQEFGVNWVVRGGAWLLHGLDGGGGV